MTGTIDTIELALAYTFLGAGWLSALILVTSPLDRLWVVLFKLSLACGIVAFWSLIGLSLMHWRGWL